MLFASVLSAMHHMPDRAIQSCSPADNVAGRANHIDMREHSTASDLAAGASDAA